MIKGLRGASIWSEDVKNLLPFYRDVLGLKVGFESPGFVVLGELGAPALALGTHSEVRGRNADPARHMVALTTDDARALTQLPRPLFCMRSAPRRPASQAPDRRPTPSSSRATVTTWHSGSAHRCSSTWLTM